MKKIFFVIIVCCVALMSSCEKDAPDYRSKWLGFYFPVQTRGNGFEIVYMERTGRPLYITAVGDSMIHLGGHMWNPGADTTSHYFVDTTIYINPEGNTLNDDGTMGWKGLCFYTEPVVCFYYRGANAHMGNPGSMMFERCYVKSDYPNIQFHPIYNYW